MDGGDLIRHLGRSRVRASVVLASVPGRQLPGSMETLSEAYGISLLGVVEKPVTPDKLGPLIQRHETAHSRPDPRMGTRLSFAPGELRDGFGNNEFEPFFQPKIELATGRIKGAEALARWRHPQHGMVAPSAFMNLLEDNGLIDELAWVMLRRAAAFRRAWQGAGPGATVSVNLSLKSLEDRQIVGRMTEIARSQELNPRQIVLELAESASISEAGPQVLENLAGLRTKGFGLSIDDYGTGTSSMSRLAAIAVTEIKIDRAFVTNATHDESARAILKSGVALAKTLNITAVAEGVETQADWNLLRRLDCGLAQGYFIARPMEAAVFLDWDRDWQQISFV